MYNSLRKIAISSLQMHNLIYAEEKYSLQNNGTIHSFLCIVYACKITNVIDFNYFAVEFTSKGTDF
jgi:hypothetical protein